MKAKELVDLFDENRAPLGKIAERRDERAPGEYQSIVHICIFNSRGELLVQKRSREKRTWPELWDVSAAGGVDAGESSRQAACRECREELGFVLELGDKRPAITLHIPRGFDDFYVVNCDLDIDALTLQAEEVTAVRWAEKKEVLELVAQEEFVPYNPAFIELLFSIRNGAPVIRR